MMIHRALQRKPWVALTRAAIHRDVVVGPAGLRPRILAPCSRSDHPFGAATAPATLLTLADRGSLKIRRFSTLTGNPVALFDAPRLLGDVSSAETLNQLCSVVMHAGHDKVGTSVDILVPFVKKYAQLRREAAGSPDYVTLRALRGVMMRLVEISPQATLNSLLEALW